MSTAEQPLPAPAAGSGDSSEPTPAPASAHEVATEIASQLMDGKIDGVTVELTPTPPEASPAPEAAAPAPDAPVIETPVVPDAPAAPPTPEESPALVLPTVPHPYDDPEDPGIEEIDPKFTKIRANVEKLQGKLRSAREAGQFGQAVIDTAVSAGLDPGQLAAIVGLSAQARRGDPAARQQLGTLMQQLGVFTPAAAPAPAPAPAPDAVTAAEVHAVYQELFAADVAAADIDEDLARRKSRQVAETRKRASAPSSPAPSVSPALSQPTTFSPSPSPAPADPVVASASAELQRLDTEFAAAYAKAGLDFAPIRAEALHRVSEQTRKHGRTPAIRWAYEFSRIVREVQSEKAAARTQSRTAAATIPGKAPLRPGTQATPGGQKTDFTADIVAKIMAGKVDQL